MFSTIKSVKDYTGTDLEILFNSAKVKSILLARIKEIDPDTGLTINDIDGTFEANAFLRRAQAIVEIFIKKDEIDIENPSDLLILDKMTSYQAVYMLDNEDTVFQQSALTSQGQTDFVVNFNKEMHSPWLAPLAVIASYGLSWKKSKSFRTGKIFDLPKISKWRNA
jgi:hypothetical protein